MIFLYEHRQDLCCNIKNIFVSEHKSNMGEISAATDSFLKIFLKCIKSKSNLEL